mgnify:CR=1 FL=1
MRSSCLQALWWTHRRVPRAATTLVASYARLCSSLLTVIHPLSFIRAIVRCCSVALFPSTASTNLIANYVPSQNTLLNFFPQSLNLKSSGIIILILGFLIGIFWVPVLSQIGILSFVDTIGAFFGPISGIMIADYYLIRNKHISNKDIFSSISGSSYFYSNGWQIKGIYALFIGFIFSAATIWNSDLIFLHSFSWLIGAFVSWITYYLLASD